MNLPYQPLAIASVLCLCAAACSAAAPGSPYPGGGVASTDSGSGLPAGVVTVPLARCATPVISALGVNGPIYTAKVTLGGSQAFDLLLDTGSSEMTVASSSCTDCTGASPRFTPDSTAVDLHQTDSIQYGAGDLAGELYADNAQVAGAPTVPVNLLAVTKSAGFFGGRNAICNTDQGILGLAPPSPGESDYFTQLVGLRGVANVFAVGLCDTTGSLWLGGYPPSAATGDPQFTPMDDSRLYYVQLTGFEVARTALTVPSTSYGSVVVDTGDPMLRLPGDAFQAVTAAIASNPEFQSLFGGADWFSSSTQLPTCKASGMTAAQLDASLPTLTLTFGSGPSISVEARATSSYLQAQNSGGATVWCPGLVPLATATASGGSGSDAGAQGSNAVGIVGDSFLRSSVVIFDRQNSRMGFAPHACP
jgi:hypothetical protein